MQTNMNRKAEGWSEGGMLADRQARATSRRVVRTMEASWGSGRRVARSPVLVAWPPFHILRTHTSTTTARIASRKQASRRRAVAVVRSDQAPAPCQPPCRLATDPGSRSRRPGWTRCQSTHRRREARPTARRSGQPSVLYLLKPKVLQRPKSWAQRRAMLKRIATPTSSRRLT